MGAELEFESLPSPAGGAESLGGRSMLSLFADLRLVGSPRFGVGLGESMASLVFGLSRVPRTFWE